MCNFTLNTLHDVHPFYSYLSKGFDTFFSVFLELFTNISKLKQHPNCCHVLQKDTDIRVNEPLTCISLERAHADLCPPPFPNIPMVFLCWMWWWIAALPCHRSSPVRSCSSPTVRGCFLPACPGRCPGEGEEQSAEREGEQMEQLDHKKMPTGQQMKTVVIFFSPDCAIVKIPVDCRNFHYLGFVTLRYQICICASGPLQNWILYYNRWVTPSELISYERFLKPPEGFKNL